GYFQEATVLSVSYRAGRTFRHSYQNVIYSLSANNFVATGSRVTAPLASRCSPRFPRCFATFRNTRPCSDLWRWACYVAGRTSSMTSNGRIRRAGNPGGLGRVPQEVCVTNRRSGMRWGVRLALALALGVVAVSPAAAQSTIFNIPTTDTVAPQHGYF